MRDRSAKLFPRPQSSGWPRSSANIFFDFDWRANVPFGGGFGCVRCGGNAVWQGGSHARRSGHLFRIGRQFFHASAAGWAWWGKTSRRRMRRYFEKRQIDIHGLERATGKTFFWAGRYGSGSQRSRHAGHGFECVRAIQSQACRMRIRDSSHIFLANIDPSLQSSVLKQIRVETEIGGAGHHELLDRAHAGGAARDSEARSDSDDQRRGNTAACQRTQPAARGAPRFSRWARRRW